MLVFLSNSFTSLKRAFQRYIICHSNIYYIIVSLTCFTTFFVSNSSFVAHREAPQRHHTQGHLQPPHHQTGGRRAALKLQHGHHAHREQEVTDILHGLSYAAFKHFISPCKIQKIFVKKEYVLLKISILLYQEHVLPPRPLQPRPPALPLRRVEPASSGDCFLSLYIFIGTQVGLRFWMLLHVFREGSQAVTHPSTNLSQLCLTSLIEGK